MLTIGHRKQLHAGNVAKIGRTTPRNGSNAGDHPASAAPVASRALSSSGSTEASVQRSGGKLNAIASGDEQRVTPASPCRLAPGPLTISSTSPTWPDAYDAAAAAHTHGDPAQQALVWYGLIAFVATVVCFFVFGGR